MCIRDSFYLMIRRPPRSTQGVSSAASDVYKRQAAGIYIVRLGYSGGQDPQVWHISGNNSWTISRNTSTDTVKITNASGNQRTAILWTT